MKERQILFSAPMVRAILDGRKTQTRRVIKTQPKGDFWRSSFDFIRHILQWTTVIEPVSTWPHKPVKCPYGQVGDRLWVRETCRAKELSDVEARQRAVDLGDEYPEYGLDGVEYLADYFFRPIENTQEASQRWCDLNAYRGKQGATVPPIHMPRWASRITLEIVSIRVERLQEISEADAIAEGCPGFYAPMHPDQGQTDGQLPHQEFAALWESINGAGSWDANPWVWVVEFKKVVA